MKIKITKKSIALDGWYNNRIGQEFKALSYPYSFGGLVVISVWADGDYALVNKGDFEFIKEQK